MVDKRAKQEQLRSAIISQDAYRIAKVFQIPPIAPTQRGTEPRSHSPQSLTINDVDYGPLFTSLLDACAAAETVSGNRWLQ